MKKTRLLILAAAAVALAGCIRDKIKPETKTYTVTVTVTGSGTAEAEPAKAAEGTKITLTAKPADGYLFEKWTVVSGEATLEDPAADQTEFTMPAEDVEIGVEFLEDIDIFTLIPDPVFLEYCRQFDTDADGKLSRNEAKEVKTINTFRMDISTLEGIEYFSSLDTLWCVRNPLTFLDVSKNKTLTTLTCGYCQQTTLDLSKNVNLTSLTCSGNPLGTIDVSKNIALTKFSCNDCQLTTLDLSKNTELTSFGCRGNQLTTLDVSFNTKLVDLDCSENKLTSLDVSKNTLLTWLSCRTNRMSVLDATNMAFDEEGEYTIRCGDQKTASGISQTLTITLRDDMKEYWNANLNNSAFNTNVVLAD